MRNLSLLISFLALFNVVVAQSPHGDLKGKDCGSCHNPQNWIVDTKKLDFDHSTTKFPLKGQHSSVDCQTCHTTLKFEGTPVTCSSCHTSVHGNTLSNDCQSCHTPENWLVKEILPLHERSRFPLFGAHQTADCGMCHQNYEVRQFEPVQTDCYSCHAKDYFATAVPNHPNGKFSTDCTMCHDVKAVNWRSSNINHEFFPLTGGHSRPSCYDCHNQTSFAGLSRECYSCHQPNFEAAKNPDHVLGNFSKQCQTCHNINAWVPAQFDHNLTTFPLTGKHTSVQCSSCHTQGYTGTPKACVSCHQTDYNGTTNPNHLSASFPTTCESCHSTSGWQPAQFDHDGPFFPIYSGQHRGEWNACSDCHTNPASFADFTCTSCHEHNQNDMNSEHQGIQGYRWESSACYACHPSGDANGAFNHQLSPFPLTGAHVTTDCALCHTTGYANTPNDCYTCHQQGFNLTNKLNHTLAGFSQNCTQCHNTTAWATTTFNHTTSSGFPLQNSHAGKTCIDCHQTSYTTTTNECSSCHMPDYQGSTNPNHVAGNYPQLCSSCHTDVGWAPATFDHTIVNFPITGRHTTAACADCHTTGFTNTPNQCSGCHLDDYQTAQNPNHIGAQFPQTCETCHTSSGWAPATFEHDIQYFPINSGKHRNEWNNDCRTCHNVPTNYSAFTCIDCHEHDQISMNQEHQGVQGYIYASTECFACHPDGTSNGAFNHTTSQFPLTGNHLTLTCNQCHATGYPNTPNDCYSCHQTGYNLTNRVNHTLAGFSQNCTECHNTSGWVSTTFNHSTTTGFPLTNAHSTPVCSACHQTTYTGTVSECSSCHIDDYNAATNPNHVAPHFPTVCNECHTNSAWVPSTFNHDVQYFPIYSGKHRNEWDNNCLSCHTVPGNFASFSCIDCHEHNQTSMNQEHQGVANYSWNSQRCFECHPDGEDAISLKQDHSFYPISGKHTSVTCNECHSAEGGKPQCVQCHQEELTTAHKLEASNTRCWECHNTISFNFDGVTPKKLERID